MSSNIDTKCNSLWDQQNIFRAIVVFIIICISFGNLFIIIFPFSWKFTRSIPYEDVYTDFNEPYVSLNNEKLLLSENQSIYAKFVIDIDIQYINKLELIIPNSPSFIYSNKPSVHLSQNGWNEQTLTHLNTPDISTYVFSEDEAYNIFDVTNYITEYTNVMSFKISYVINNIFEYNSKEYYENNNILFINYDEIIHVKIYYSGFGVSVIPYMVLFNLILIISMFLFVLSYQKRNVLYMFYCKEH